MELTEEGLAGFFEVALPLLDERQRRLVGAAMVGAFGRGGQARVSVAAGLSRDTLLVGASGFACGAGPAAGGPRPRAGRKPALAAGAPDC